MSKSSPEPSLHAQWIAHYMALIGTQPMWEKHGEWRLNNIWYWLDRIEKEFTLSKEDDGLVHHEVVDETNSSKSMDRAVDGYHRHRTTAPKTR